MTKLPLAKRSNLTFINPFQKGESVGIAETWDKVFKCRFFLFNSALATSNLVRFLGSLEQGCRTCSSSRVPQLCIFDDFGLQVRTVGGLALKKSCISFLQGCPPEQMC
jgi:hypothetical protein